MIEQISIDLFCLFLTCLFQFSAFSQHDNCTGNCGPRNYSSLDCAESLVACSEKLVGCAQKECQPLEVKAPPSKSSNSPHTDACVTPLWNRRPSTPAEEVFTECTESALQTILLQENGPLPEVQRCMLVLSAMLTGASVDHGRRPVLVSLSTFSAAADTRKLRNGMCNDQEPSREKWQATRTALPPDFNMAESWSSEEVNKGSQNATAAHPATSSAVGASSVVSRSMLQTKIRKKKIFFHILGKYIC